MSWRACGSVCLVFVGLAGCFSPSFEDGKLQCGPAAQCPPGLSCVEGLCRTGGAAGDAGTQHAVTVNTTGPGSGMIVSTPGGISCPGTCTSSFADGTVVSLAATPTATATFAGWSGAGCSGTGTCTFTVTGDTALQAAFAANNSLVVAKAGNGTGTVTSSPSGIACGTTCSQVFPQGSMVTLTATAGTGSTFTGWSGACSGTGACTVTISGAQMVTATFALQQDALSVTKSGTGTGTVTSMPSGIACGPSCSATYDYGTMVTLTATPDTGSTFTGWTGGGCSGTGTCTVTMLAAASVEAKFAVQQFTLAVNKTGSGTGTVTSTPAGIDCGSACAVTFTYGQTVTLTATAGGTGNAFQGWSGASCSGIGTCVITMTANVTVTAAFIQGGHTVTYVANGATGGSVPPPAVYGPGQTVIVAGNTGSLVKTNYNFSGWNTAADRTGTTYPAGTGTFAMPAADVTLYAYWIATTPVVLASFADPGTSRRPEGIAYDGTYLYVGEVNDSKIYKVDPATGAAISSFAIVGTHALALDGAGNVWTTSYWADPPVLYRYPLAGGASNKSLTLASTMDYPTALAYDTTTSDFWMVNTNSTNPSHVWQLSSADGSSLGSWDPTGGTSGVTYGACMDSDHNFVWLTYGTTLAKVSVVTHQIAEQYTIPTANLLEGCAPAEPFTFWLVSGNNMQIMKVDVP